MKNIVTSLVILAFSAALSMNAQTMCFGATCSSPSLEHPQTQWETQNTHYDLFLARSLWDRFNFEEDPEETREQCIARCQSEYSGFIAACNAVHDEPAYFEPPTVTDARGACYDEARSRRAECLTPMHFGRCP